MKDFVERSSVTRTLSSSEPTVRRSPDIEKESMEANLYMYGQDPVENATCLEHNGSESTGFIIRPRRPPCL